MIYELDNEWITSINIVGYELNFQSASIALNSLSRRKKKWDADSGLFYNANLLVEAFEKSTKMLAKPLVTSWSLTTPSSSSISLSSAFPTLASYSDNLRQLNQQITKVETRFEGLVIKLGNMKNILDKIFATVSGSS